MKIVLSGVETNNKGAELMLYAILQEVERKFPEAVVYLPYYQVHQGLKYVDTKLKLKTMPLSKLAVKLNLPLIFYLLKLPQTLFAKTSIVKDADWFIDGSGFAFGDQWTLSDNRIKYWELKLKPLYERGCKIVFLPQAFGPVQKEGTRKALTILNRYADIIIAREQVSYDYIKDSGKIDMNKVKIFSDFTSLVEGRFPLKYEHLRNGVCIIPNMQMINNNNISYNDYVHLLSSIAIECEKSGHPVYLLNHEGKEDDELCVKCKESFGGAVQYVTNLNAIEVKGLIASAYVVITSRFHGLASSLNSCVPSLATSWNHKYEELFRDYGLNNYVLPINDEKMSVARVKELLDGKENERIRKQLNEKVPTIKEQTRRMWDCVWSLK